MLRQQRQFPALGSRVLLTLAAADDFPFKDTFSVLKDNIDSFEKRFSRFLPDSELTRFNENAGHETAIGPEFKHLLETSRYFSELTDGLFNPFILPALQHAGYKGSWPSPDALNSAKDYSNRKLVPYQELKIYESTAAIPPNSALDFGGIGKGYLLNQLNKLLVADKLDGFWLSLGGDIVIYGSDIEKRAWSIQVQHAFNPQENIVAITNPNAGSLFVATSGVTKRRGTNASGDWHHIINPKTAMPAKTDILTATVTAADGVRADIYAKIIIIAGEEKAAILKRTGEIKSFVLQYEAKDPVIEL